ncbi:hypothetical protein C5167_027094 [Papaver somniferum]|nr:hypothetical protein C5167_027094 [Papaver somniferum]
MMMMNDEDGDPMKTIIMMMIVTTMIVRITKITEIYDDILANNFKSDPVFGFKQFNLVFSKIQYIRYLQQVHLELSIPIGEQDLLLELKSLTRA